MSSLAGLSLYHQLVSSLLHSELGISMTIGECVPPNQHLLFIAVFYSPLCPVHANTFVLFMLSFHVTPPSLLYRQHLS